MGLRNVCQLILAAEVFEILKPSREIGALSFRAFRERATCAARLTSRILDYAGRESGHATAAGLMHGVGFLLLWSRATDVLEESIEEASGRDTSVQTVVREKLGVSEAELGAALLLRWGSPLEVVEAIANQEHTRQYDSTELDLRSSLHVATSLLANPVHRRKVQEATLDRDFVAQHTLHEQVASWRSMADELQHRCQHLTHAPPTSVSRHALS